MEPCVATLGCLFSPMNSQVRLAPSILTADFGHLRDAIEQADAAGVDALHLDVMDGHFVPNITFGPDLIACVRSLTATWLDVHLMVAEPLRMIDQFIQAGADSLTIHAEACRDAYRVLDTIQQQNRQAGIALNPGTACSAVVDLLPMVDRVLIMSVPPGFGGAPYIPSTPAKIRRMHALLQDLPEAQRPDLQVDGGIDGSNIRDVVQAGVNSVVAGSSIYNKRGSVRANVLTLREKLRGA